MGKIRSINHPGIEVQEFDRSGAAEQVGGTTALVVGFFPQGESGVAVSPTTTSSLKTYFGTPENEAERCAYYAAKEVLDKKGRLIAARIPYNNNSQYITPTVKLNIEEWSTTHTQSYSPTSGNYYDYQINESYDNLPDSVSAAFIYDEDTNPLLWKPITIKTVDTTTGQQIEREIDTISSSPSASEKGKQYFSVYVDNSKQQEILANVLNARIEVDMPDAQKGFNAWVDGYEFEKDDDGNNQYTTFAVKLSSYNDDVLADSVLSSYDFTNSETTGRFVTINQDDQPVFWDVEFDFATKTLEVKTDSYSGRSKLKTLGKDSNGYKYDWGTDLSIFTSENYGSGYFDISESVYRSTSVSYRKQSSNELFYTETANGDEESDGTVVPTKDKFMYSKVHSQPTSGVVYPYSDAGTVSAMVIKSYYDDENGVQYLSADSEDFYEVKIAPGYEYLFKTMEDLNGQHEQYFNIVHERYVGVKTKETVRISQSGFKAVPVSSDFTVGQSYEYGPEGAKVTITSDDLAIKACDEASWESESVNYPTLKEVDPFGTGEYIYVLDKIGQGTTEFYKDNTDFFQLVTPYSGSAPFYGIKKIALNASEDYRWIHWKTADAKDEFEITDKDKSNGNVLMSAFLGVSSANVPTQLSEIENVVAITPDIDNKGYMNLGAFQDLRDGVKRPDENTIVIANITEQRYGQDMYNNGATSDDSSSKYDYPEEVLGIVPVLIGGFQALPKQSRIVVDSGYVNTKVFNAVETLVRGASLENVKDSTSDSIDPSPESEHEDIKAIFLNDNGYVRSLGSTEGFDAFESNYSNEMLGKVPSIDLNARYKPNGSKVNYVTLAVCQLTLSKVNDNKIAVTVLENFTGSLDRNAKDEDDNSMFIDDIVNNDVTGSSYVRLFSNYVTRLEGSTEITPSTRTIVKPATLDTKVTCTVPYSCGTKLWWTKPKRSFSLGFTKGQSDKFISYATIVATLENVFDQLSNVDELDLDLIVDAGLTTIANYIKMRGDEDPSKTKFVYDSFYDEIKQVEDIAGWKSVCSKFLTFCESTRKDCLAIVDAPRSLCVKNNAALVDSIKSRPNTKYTIDYDILPKFNYVGGLNSSYIAGYCDWLLAVDDFTSKSIWLPQSIAAVGSILYTDDTSNYWMAPAGATRGNVSWAVKPAFVPNSQQADSIYAKAWNYAKVDSGAVLNWGQKTMLNSNSTFSRIDVRRLFLRLERMCRKAVKPFIFEKNTETTRNRLVDVCDPILANVKAMEGIYDYQIICNKVNNTDSVIQNNELRAAFLIKPSITAEYLILSFFNVAQDLEFSELYSEL